MPRDGLGTVHLQIKLTPEEHQALEEKAAQSKMKPTPFARELFLQFLEKNQGAVPPRNGRWHEVLEYILENGTRDDREWITGNLKNFAEAIGSRPSQSSKPLRKRA